MERIGVAAKRIERNDEERCEGWTGAFVSFLLGWPQACIRCFDCLSGKKFKGKRVKMGIVRGEMGRLPCQGFRVAFVLGLAAHVENSTLSNHNILMKVFIVYFCFSFGGWWLV